MTLPSHRLGEVSESTPQTGQPDLSQSQLGTATDAVRDNAGTREPSTDRWEWEQLANACSARFGQDSVLWTIIGSFWSTNAVLLVAIGASGFWSDEPTLRAVICAAGVVVSLLWMFMQAAALRRVLVYEDVIKHLEARLVVPDEARLLPGDDPEAAAGSKPKRRLFPARRVMPLAPPFALAAWIAGLYFAIYG